MALAMNIARTNIIRLRSSRSNLSSIHFSRHVHAAFGIGANGGSSMSTIYSQTQQDMNYIQKRFYNKRKTLKIPPTKVLNFDYGGDLTYQDYPLDLQQPKLALDGAENLEHCDEITRRLLSMEFTDGNEKLRRRLKEVVSRVQEHSLDTRSLEVIIAYQTVCIRNQVRHVLSFRKDKTAKSLLVLRLQARRKHLTRLRAIDYEKFLWLCEELQMKYVPIPQYNQIVSKRAALKKAARYKANKIILKKVHDFRGKLLKEKEEYAAYKQEEMTKLEKEIAELDLDDSSEIKQVFNALKHGDVNTLDGNPKPLPHRRNLILQHKFKLAEIRAKERAEQI